MAHLTLRTVCSVRVKKGSTQVAVQLSYDEVGYDDDVIVRLLGHEIHSLEGLEVEIR